MRERRRELDVGGGNETGKEEQEERRRFGWDFAELSILCETGRWPPFVFSVDFRGRLVDVYFTLKLDSSARFACDGRRRSQRC